MQINQSFPVSTLGMVETTRLGNFYQVAPDKWYLLNQGAVARDTAARYLHQQQSLNVADVPLEEFVRQWVIAQIVGPYQYPVSWLGSQLTIEEPVWIGTTRCRADIALKNRLGDPVIYFETKSMGISDTEFHRAEQQLKSYLSATYTAKIGVVTDGVHTRIIRKRLDRQIQMFEPIFELPSLSEAIQQGIFSQEDVQPQILPSFEEQIVTHVTVPAQRVRAMPTWQEYKTALLSMSPYISDNQRAILQTHYHSPNHTATMTQLAHAVGYSSHRSANLQYGKLASQLCELLDRHCKVKVSILVSFIPPQRSNDNQWQLVMRPEVVKALRDVKWI